MCIQRNYMKGCVQNELLEHTSIQMKTKDISLEFNQLI